MAVDSATRKQLKMHARQDIRMAFWPAMAAVLVYLLPVTLIGIIYTLVMQGFGDTFSVEELSSALGYSVLYLIATVFIASPLQYGLWRYMTARAHGQIVSPWMVISCFSEGRLYITSIKLMLGIFIRSLGWMLLLFAAILAAALLTVFGFKIGIIVNIAVIPLSVFVYAKIRRYDAAYVAMSMTPDASVWEALKACGPIFKGHLWELVVFDLSFLLWDLLGAITLGIGSVYVTAYTYIAFAHYFDHLCGLRIAPEQTH